MERLNLTFLTLFSFFQQGKQEVPYIHLKTPEFAVLCARRVCSSGNAEGRAFTSKKARFSAFRVFRPPPVERAGNLVFACRNIKFQCFTIFTATATENPNGYKAKTLNMRILGFLPFLGTKMQMAAYLH